MTLKIDYASHYDADYFTGRKRYRDGAGQEQLYHGPALTWDGFQVIAEALSVVLPPQGTVLDIGCSGGDLASRLGLDPFGAEISLYAIQHAVSAMRGRIAYADVTTCPSALVGHGEGGIAFPDTFDVVIATDLLEHIYEEDLENTFAWMKAKTVKWMFFCVAITWGEEFIHKKGEVVPSRWEATAVSGHVNVRRFTYWARFFKEHGLKIRWDLMYLFQMRREQDRAWRDTGGWDMASTWILERR